MIIKGFLISLLFTILAAQNAVAVTCKRVDADMGFKVMKDVDEQSKSYKTQTSDVYMEIIDVNNSKRKRFFNLFKKNFESSTKSLIKFYEPSNIKNTSLLSYSFDNKNNEQWFYFPALRSIKKLNVSDKNSSFMGSDFSNADIAGRSLNDYNYCLQSEDKEHFVVDSYPKSREDKYSRLQIKVIKSISVVAEIKFYDRSASITKTLANTRIKKIDNSFLAVDSKMINHKTGGSTVIETKDVKLDLRISDRFFGVKNLR